MIGERATKQRCPRGCGGYMIEGEETSCLMCGHADYGEPITEIREVHLFGFGRKKVMACTACRQEIPNAGTQARFCDQCMSERRLRQRRDRWKVRGH